MFSKKSNNSWLVMSSAMAGGFLLGFTYKKYGKEMMYQIQKIKGKKGYDYDDYITSHEPEAE
jgi:hypothetical protein